jgi:murein DD-endopeptidase MepM/ murein hydrolase activator NlpD
MRGLPPGLPMPFDNFSVHKQRIGALLSRNSRRLSVAFVALLGGFAATAFSVAPLLPSADEIPQSLVIETVSPPGMNAQIEALADHDLQLWRSELTRSTDTVESLLRRLGVTDAQAPRLLRGDPHARRLIDGRAGKLVQVRVAADGQLLEVVARYGAPDGAKREPQFTRLSLSLAEGQWVSRVEVAPLQAQVRLASGTIRTTLFAATEEARIPDAVASQMAEIFAADVDFHRELRRGDTFSIVFEALTADGEPVTWASSTGRVMSAEFVNNGKAHHAIWYTDASGRGAYFGFDGLSKRRTFLASPLEFSRVTSRFAMRLHPILQTMRAHRGVDYAAPTGTPVRSVADGVVEFAGWQNGYGNVVKVEHGKEHSTLYAHLSRIDVRKGQKIEQGQHLGAVGATGWATGPHLHFEFLVADRHVDPLTIAKAAEPVNIDGSARARFAELSRNVHAQLHLASTLTGARVQSE